MEIDRKSEGKVGKEGGKLKKNDKVEGKVGEEGRLRNMTEKVKEKR